jgi:hypothetical protein
MRDAWSIACVLSCDDVAVCIALSGIRLSDQVVGAAVEESTEQLPLWAPAQVAAG